MLSDWYAKPSLKASVKKTKMSLKDDKRGLISHLEHHRHQWFQLDSWLLCVEEQVAAMSRSATFVGMPSAWKRL